VRYQQRCQTQVADARNFGLLLRRAASGHAVAPPSKSDELAPLMSNPTKAE
jgi:hypothetical protein